MFSLTGQPMPFDIVTKFYIFLRNLKFIFQITRFNENMSFYFCRENGAREINLIKVEIPDLSLRNLKNILNKKLW